MMSECELCGKSENYCNKCSTCLDCIDREHEETVKELERLRAQIKQTASHAQKLIEQQNDIISALEDTNAGLVQERDRLRVAGSYMSNVLYNLKQSDDIPEQHRALMGKWQAEWDKAMRYKSEES